RLRASLAIIDKRREAANISEAMNIIGEVKGKTAIILDDMVDTAGTLTQAAVALKERGAIKIHACCTHAVLSGPAVTRIDASPISRLIITNTIPLNGTAKGCRKIVVLSIAELLGETIKRSHSSHSVSTLFV
ncbi:MAG: ribose-phosphate diphosphokinase, partial [Desulfobacteraceae bacterium]|nr:ribose-phosphate diphosphokinase [Desulfobacteraceae bacterium]